MQFQGNRTLRKSLRLANYDYSSPGAYFVTICTHDRECIFGQIIDGELALNPFGKIVVEENEQEFDG